jgi:TctA family transporter
MTVPELEIPVWAIYGLGTIAYLLVAILVGWASMLLNYVLGYKGALTEEQRMGETAVGLFWPIAVPFMALYVVCVVVHWAIHGRGK